MIKKNKIPACAVIIVTYNSESHIHKAIECINQQTLSAEKIIIVDTGSNDISYLNKYRQQPNIEVVIAEKDIGFCRGNNIGMTKLPTICDYVFFLNPDAFLTHSFLKQAVAFMQASSNQQYAAITGTTLGYDIEKDLPTGTYDSTGIFRKWYGQWYDRGHGQTYNAGLYLVQEDIPAICGAVLFCRKKALDTVMLGNNEIFDNSFYMYKEDIDLSMRLQRKGWKLAFLPQLVAYHCRGWQKDRSKMPKAMRLTSARNELRVHARLKTPIPMAYSLLKYNAVKLFDV